MKNQEDIIKIIDNIICENKDLEYSFRNKKKNDWEFFLDNLSFSPVTYSNLEIDYQLLYRKELDIIENDLSLIIKYNSNNVCIFPFSISHNQNGYFLHSFGLPMHAPIFEDNIENQLEKRICKMLYKVCINITNYLKIHYWHLEECFLNKKNYSQWNVLLKSQQILKAHNTLEGFVKIPKIGSNLKYPSTLRSNIKKGSEIWSSEIKYLVTEEEWCSFKKLHIIASGKQTRSDKTWKLQLEDINIKKKGFVVFSYNDNKKLVGGTFIRFSKSTALYAVGVSDRNEWPKPISHIQQHLAIQEMQKLNLKWYKLGAIPKEGDFNKPTDKEINIGIFKKKFSTNIFNTYSFVKI